MYLNIADDVYRNQVEDVQLTDNQKDEIIEVAAKVDDDTRNKIVNLISDQTIHAGNYNSSLAKLKRQAGV